MIEVTEPIYHDYPYLPFIEDLEKVLRVVARIVGLFGWCFLCLGIGALCVYLYEKRKERMNNATLH